MSDILTCGKTKEQRELHYEWKRELLLPWHKELKRLVESWPYPPDDLIEIIQKLEAYTSKYA